MKKFLSILALLLMAVTGQAATITVTWDISTLKSMGRHGSMYDGDSFTKDGITLTVLDGMFDYSYYDDNGDASWMGNSNDASFKFSTTLGNFTKIEITGKSYSLNGTGWSMTSPGSVFSGNASETTFGSYFECTNIVFTIAPPTIDVTDITLDQTTASLKVGETVTLTATVSPDDATDKTVTWKSSDESVCTVADGVVTAVTAGTATITATATNGTADDTSDDKTATCEVTVTPATYTVTLADAIEDKESWIIDPTSAAEGQEVTLKYNGKKKVKSVTVKKKAAARALSEVTADDIGKIAGADGNIYDTQDAATTAGTTAVAVIAYVGSETDNSTYAHGLAIALSNESNKNWSSAKSTCEGKTAVTNAVWCLPSQQQWKTVFSANGGSETSYSELNTKLEAANGESSVLTNGDYWTSTAGRFDEEAYIVSLSDGSANFGKDTAWGAGGLDFKLESRCVRACLAF